MSYEGFKLEGFNKSNPYINSPVTLGGKTFNFEVRWNFEFDFGYLVIRDNNNKLLLGAIALVNGLKITLDQRVLPGYLKFVQINGEKYEPEINNIEKEFTFYYVNE